eukprot:10062379-Alexandrium_andersonii.AAC.1
MCIRDRLSTKAHRTTEQEAHRAKELEWLRRRTRESEIEAPASRRGMHTRHRMQYLGDLLG